MPEITGGGRLHRVLEEERADVREMLPVRIRLQGAYGLKIPRPRWLAPDREVAWRAFGVDDLHLLTPHGSVRAIERDAGSADRVRLRGHGRR